MKELVKSGHCGTGIEEQLDSKIQEGLEAAYPKNVMISKAAFSL